MFLPDARLNFWINCHCPVCSPFEQLLKVHVRDFWFTSCKTFLSPVPVCTVKTPCYQRVSTPQGELPMSPIRYIAELVNGSKTVRAEVRINVTEQQKIRTLIGQYVKLANREERITYALELTALLYVVERRHLEIELEIEDLPRVQQDEIIAEVVEGKRPFPPVMKYGPSEIAEFSLGFRHQRELAQLSDFRLKRFIVDAIKEQYEKTFSALQDSDVDYWVKLPIWKPEEAAALSLSYEPSELTQDLVHREFAGSALGFSFTRRLLAIQRAVETGELKPPITASAFVNWAISRELSLPPRLTAAVARFPAPTETGEQLQPKERHSLLEIIHVLAFGHPGVDDAEERKARDNILNLCANYPLSLHRDTVAKHLGAAASRIASVMRR